MDYEATSEVLTFGAGETVKTVQVTAVRDSLDEPDEFFALQLSEPRNAELGTQRVLAEIQDDDTRGVTLSDGEGPVALVSLEEGAPSRLPRSSIRNQRLR